VSSTFLSVDVDPGPASEEGLSLRFKLAGEQRSIVTLRYESEHGLDGFWNIHATHSLEGHPDGSAQAAQVDDSSDGVVWLVYGGRQGLVLVHQETHVTERVAYLVLSRIA
jgi:hypothetical protein